MDIGLLTVVLGAVLTGGPALTYIAIRKATPERESLQVATASKNTEDALALLDAEREMHRETVDRLTAAGKRIVDELAAERAARAQDLERLRQYEQANQALIDQVDAERANCTAVRAELARVREAREEIQ